jgi:hypothetical protein
VVVDALVNRPEILALLERHVAAVALPQGRRLDVPPPPRPPVPRNPAAGAQEAVGIREPEVGEPPTVAGRESRGSDASADGRRLVIVFGFLRPGRHVHDTGAGSVGGDCGGVCGRNAHTR